MKGRNDEHKELKDIQDESERFRKALAEQRKRDARSSELCDYLEERLDSIDRHLKDNDK